MINLLKPKNVIVILVILVVIVVGMSSVGGNRLFGDIVAFVRGEEIVHVTDMNDDADGKDTINDDVEIFFKKLEDLGKLNYFKNSFGLEMWSFKMRDFFDVSTKMMKEDIYCYLEEKPNLSEVHKN